MAKPPTFTGTLTIDEGAGPFVRDQTIHLDASWNKNAPGNNAPWVEVRIVQRGEAMPQPGNPDDIENLVLFKRDYESAYEIVLGDEGGSSVWRDLGYPAATGQAFLFAYYGNPEKTALYASTPSFDID